MIDVARNGDRFVLDKAPGITLLAVPVVALTDLLKLELSFSQLTWLLSVILCSLPTLIFMSRLKSALGNNTESDLMALAVVLASPWAAYAGMLFGHALAASCIGLGSLWALGSLEHQPKPEASSQRKEAFLGGLTLGLAVLTEYTTAILVLFVLVAVLLDPIRRHRVQFVILGGLLPLGALLSWNTLNFGTPFTLSYDHLATSAHASIIQQGVFGISWPSATRLWGILMGAQRGLLFLAPWLFLSFIGAVLAFKTPTLPRGWRIMLPLSIFGFPLIVSGFVDWTAGLSMGPRHLLALLPVMAIATHLSMKYKPESSKLRHLGPLLVGLWVSSAAICVTSAYVFPYFDTLTDNPFFEVTVPVLMNGGSGPTLWDAILDSTTVWAIALLFTALLLTFRGLRLTRGREEPRSAGLIRGLLIVLAICAHLGVSLQIQSPGDHGEREVLKARAFAHEMLGQEQQAARVHKVLAAPPANGRIPR